MEQTNRKTDALRMLQVEEDMKSFKGEDRCPATIFE